MLEELTTYKTFGSAAHLTEIVRAIKTAPCTVVDLFVIADSNNTVEIPRIEAAIKLLKELGLCTIENDIILGTANLEALVGSQPQSSGAKIGQILLQKMIHEGLLPVAKIQYDLDGRYGYLKQNDIALKYSQMRNYLISAGILLTKNDRLLFTQASTEILKNEVIALEGNLSPERLAEKLKRDKAIGAAAESFVMEYERGRLGTPLADFVQQVSLVSVSAGYDIASFESSGSIHYDRFIEVKAVGSNGFYLSENELKTAKRLRKQYCLYLIDMNKKNQTGYEPEIIADPSEYFAKSTDWRVIPESYHISRVFQ